jgi:putative ABC transport system ATP-binding protein
VTGAAIEKLLFSYNKKNGTTLIVVTHDIDLAKRCDMQIYIKDGKVLRVLGGQ